MKTIKFFLAIQILFILFNCSSDGESDSFKYDNSFTTVGFIVNNLKLEEGGPSLSVVLNFSQPTREEGIITIKASDLHNLEISGATINNDSEILINFTKNTTSVSFNITRPNDNVITENVDPYLLLKDITRPNYLNQSNRLQLDVSDDELAGLPKSFETNTINYYNSKVTYLYNVDGKLKKVKYLSNNDQYEEFDEYNYDSEGQLISTDYYYNNEKFYSTNYVWENGLIVSSTTENSDKSYVRNTTYEYNTNGQIIEKKDSVENNLDEITYYSYFSDGNLHEINTYYGLDLIYTTTINSYTDTNNQFPEWNIIPTINVQSELPISLETYYYDWYTASDVINYTYEYDEFDRLVKRKSGNEITIYTYY